MPTYQTTGIVIGRTNFGEADRIVRFLTPDHGKLNAVAKGVRKIKSRAAGHLELFGEVGLMLATGRNLDVVTSARLHWYPHQLTTDYDRLNLAYLMATAVDRLVEPSHPSPALYQLLRDALRELDTGAIIPLLQLWFKLRLLKALGYQPDINHCVVCGRHDEISHYRFSPERGGIICDAEADALAHPMSLSAIKLWRLLYDYPYAQIARIADAGNLATNTLAICDLFYEHHLGRSFTTPMP